MRDRPARSWKWTPTPASRRLESHKPCHRLRQSQCSAACGPNQAERVFSQVRAIGHDCTSVALSHGALRRGQPIRACQCQHAWRGNGSTLPPSSSGVCPDFFEYLSLYFMMLGTAILIRFTVVCSSIALPIRPRVTHDSPLLQSRDRSFQMPLTIVLFRIPESPPFAPVPRAGVRCHRARWLSQSASGCSKRRGLGPRSGRWGLPWPSTGS